MVPVAFSLSRCKTCRKVFKIEFQKAFGAVGSPGGKARPVKTDIMGSKRSHELKAKILASAR